MKSLTDTLQGLLRRGAPPASAPVPSSPPVPAPDRLDSYARRTPDRQQTIDIFKGIWSSRFPADCGIEAGEAALFEDNRIEWLIETLGGVGGYRILELGPLEGGHSYMLQQAGAEHVLAIEACTVAYLKCLIVKDLLKLDRVDFRYGNFMSYLAACNGRFDVIVASGVLYHQTDPITCIKDIARCTDQAFFWTHYFDPDADSGQIVADYFTPVRSPMIEGFQCALYRLQYDAYLKGAKYIGALEKHTHWMRKDDILACLAHFGFDDIRTAFVTEAHPYGPNMAMLARRR